MKEVVLPGWPIFAAYLLIGLPPALRWFRERTSANFPSALIFATSLFVLLGCFAPSRYQYQHYFALMPLLALGIASGFIHRGDWLSKWRLAILAPLAVFSAALDVRANVKDAGADAYQWLGELRTPERWFPFRGRALAKQIREHLSDGKILTLAPAWPLEAGLKIYPEFATGPFAWRAATLLPTERRSHLKMVAPADLDIFLAKDPPAGVLTGFETAALEKPLVRYAERHGFRPVKLGKERILWVP